MSAFRFCLKKRSMKKWNFDIFSDNKRRSWNKTNEFFPLCRKWFILYWCDDLCELIYLEKNERITTKNIYIFSWMEINLVTPVNGTPKYVQWNARCSMFALLVPNPHSHTRTLAHKYKQYFSSSVWCLFQLWVAFLLASKRHTTTWARK